MKIIPMGSTFMNSSLVQRPFLVKSFISPFWAQRAFLTPRFPHLKCRSGSEEKESGKNGSDFKFKDAVSGMVDEQVQELLSRKENRVLLDGLEEASRRVEMAKRELALIEEQELAAKKFRDYINQLEGQASEVCSWALIFFF